MGAVLGTALICGIIAWWLLRRRRSSVQEIITSAVHGPDRPPLPPKEKRSSYGYYDLKSAEQVVDAGRVRDDDVALQDLKAARQREREDAVELPTDANVQEMITSPTGAAHEMPSPPIDEAVRERDRDGRGG